MTWVLFQKIIHDVHRHCFEVATKVNDDLEKKFHAQDVMDPLDVVYPQYWFKSIGNIPCSYGCVEGVYSQPRKLGSTQT